MGLLDKLQDSMIFPGMLIRSRADGLHQELELYRLEQRYTRRRNKTAFVSEAQYVDGEYVYSTPSPNREVSKQTHKGPSKVRISEINRGKERLPGQGT